MEARVRNELFKENVLYDELSKVHLRHPNMEQKLDQ